MTAKAIPAKPYPTRTTLNAPYLDGLKARRLTVQKCKNCGHLRFPAAPQCPQCLADETEWVALSGKGRIWSYIVMHQQYFASFAADLPYNVIMVELDEGPTMMSTLVDPNERAACDARVEVVFDGSDDRVVPKFKLV
jgi:uncharacterized OB-fold protein